MKQRIAAYNRFYKPHIAPTGVLLADVCEELEHGAFDVRVCASRSKYGNAPQLTQKLLGQFRYALKAVFFGLAQPRGTIAISASDPPYLGILVTVIARLKGHRVVLWLQDRYPELAVEFGLMRESSVLYFAWKRLDRWARRHADAVVVIGEVMRERVIADGTPADKVHVIHNWVDTARVYPVDPALNSIRPADNDTVFLYAGNAGRAHDMSSLVEVLTRKPDVQFWFAGNGYQLNQLRTRAAGEAWKNVRFLDYVPAEKLADLLSAGDVGVVTEKESVVGLLLPSKIYGILAAGRPVLYIGPEDSDAARLIRRHDCGVVVASGDTSALARAIDQLMDSNT